MKTNRVKSLLLALFLFCFSLAITLITADVVFSQVSGMELATEARSLYNNREYRDAVDLWQKAANGTLTIFTYQKGVKASPDADFTSSR